MLNAKFFLESLVQIVNKDRHTIPFILNPSQLRFYRNRTLRDIILKARQLGFSTEIIGLFLHDTMYVPNTISVIVAHTEKDASDLFERAKFMYFSVPEVFRPTFKRSNSRELVFENINSKMFIGSAEAKEFGRSKTISNLHLSEMSATAYSVDFLNGILESVPSSGRVVMESTARGEGGPFYEYYMKARARENEYINHYYKWYEHSEYQIPLHPGEKLIYSEEELELIYQAHLTPEQIKWRRIKKSRLGAKFIQEYPEVSDEDAFIRSGSPVFDIELLKARDAQLPEQKPTEIWMGGNCFIYKIAQPNARYVIGLDTSEGDINSDYSAAMVIKSFPPPIEQVALLHGRWTPDFFSEKVYRLGKAYNTAMLVVERNNHGHAVLLNLSNGIVRQGLVKYPPYTTLYSAADRKLGWLTTGSTKPTMIQELDRAIRNGTFVINSKAFITEARRYAFLKSDRMGAPSGSYDDVVMSAALALMGVMGGSFDAAFIG